MIVSKKLRESAAARFSGKYEPCPETGCWLWVASVNTNRGGYGSFYFGREKMGAHRAAWIIHRGAVPWGLHVLHKCDTPACVNPEHLFLGTNAENVADMDSKGRRVNRPSPGELNGRAKLTEEQALEIFASSEPQDAEAAKYGVSRSMVSLIRLGKAWQHVTGGRP